jgi:hypothetical protein
MKQEQGIRKGKSSAAKRSRRPGVIRAGRNCYQELVFRFGRAMLIRSVF